MLSEAKHLNSATSYEILRYAQDDSITDFLDSLFASTVFEVAWASCPWFTGETPVPLRDQYLIDAEALGMTTVNAITLQSF